MRKVLMSPVVTQEVADLAKVFQMVGKLFAQASTLAPPQTAESIELDVCNASRRRNDRSN